MKPDLLSAFSELRNKLRRYAFLKLGSFHDADDVVQETAVACMRYEGPELETHKHARKLVWTILRRRAADVLRKRRTTNVEATDDLPDSDPTHLEKILGAEQKQFFEELIAQLSHDDRELVLARLVKNEPLKEIAKRQGIAISTASERTHRVLSTIARQLATYLGHKDD